MPRVLHDDRHRLALTQRRREHEAHEGRRTSLDDAFLTIRKREPSPAGVPVSQGIVSRSGYRPASTVELLPARPVGSVYGDRSWGGVEEVRWPALRSPVSPDVRQRCGG